MVIEITLANNSISAFLKPSYWESGTLFVGIYIIPLGLVPGLLLHAFFVRLRWSSLWQYSLAGLFLGAAWATIFYQWIGVGGEFMAGIVAAALFGTATFWVSRRPDRIDPRAAAA